MVFVIRYSYSKTFTIITHTDMIYNYKFIKSNIFEQRIVELLTSTLITYFALTRLANIDLLLLQNT